ncbi:MAG: hypothetical protein AB1638_00520, partial [Nitrospirota bacterium]
RGTAGKEKPHPSLTIEWILGQFGPKSRQSEKKYSEFVMAGIGKEEIWKDALTIYQAEPSTDSFEMVITSENGERL